MQRKQLKRGIKDWRMLPNSRSVARPSRWGNPYRIVYGKNLYGWMVVKNHTINGTKTPYKEWFYGKIGEEWTKEQAAQKATELYREHATERLKREPDWLDPLSGLDNVY